jgi:hypothetical protein
VSTSVSSIADSITPAGWQTIGGLAVSVVAILAGLVALRGQSPAGTSTPSADQTKLGVGVRDVHRVTAHASTRTSRPGPATSRFQGFRAGIVRPGQMGEPMATEDTGRSPGRPLANCPPSVVAGDTQR